MKISPVHQIEICFTIRAEEKPGDALKLESFPYIFDCNHIIYCVYGSMRYMASETLTKAFLLHSLHSIFKVIPKKGHGLSLSDINY